jgi:hypothetical protein
MGKQKAPDPPDYSGLAAEQGLENRDTALFNNYLNNPNYITPYGSQRTTYNMGGASGFDEQAYLDANPRLAAYKAEKGLGDGWAYRHYQRHGASEGRDHGQGQGWTDNPVRGEGEAPYTLVTQTFSPEQQALYDSENALKQNSLDTATGMMNRVGEAYDQPFDTSPYGFSDYSTADLPDVPQYDSSGFQDLTGIDTNALSPASQGLDFSQAGDFGSYDPSQLGGFGSYDPSQLQQLGGLSNENLQGMTDLDMSQLYQRTVDPSLAGQEDVYQALNELNRPDQEARQRAQEADLMARGFAPGGTGYDARMQTLGDDVSRQQLQNRIYAGEAQDRMIGNEAMLRGQGLNEQIQSLNADMGIRGTQFGERQGIDQSQQNIRGQQWGEQGDMANLADRQRAQQWGEQGDVANLADRQRGQRVMEEQAIESFATMLRNQGMDEQAVQAQVNMAMNAQQSSNEARRVGLGETQRAARFNENSEQSRYDNWVAQQEYQRANFERNRPLAELNSLRTGNNPQMPQFQQYQAANAQAAPIFDAGIAQGNFDLQNAQNQPDVMGGLFDLGGAFLGAGGAAGGFGKLFGSNSLDK